MLRGCAAVIIERQDMEVRVPSNNRTNIEAGVANIYAGRKYVGAFWINSKKGGVAHGSDLCSSKRDTSKYRRLPVYEQDGIWYWYDKREDHYGQTQVCAVCPEPQETNWMEQGACFGTEELGFANGDERVIAEYCDICPVRLECLEFGASLEREHAGSIWGGVLFPRNDTYRRALIDKKRKEYADDTHK